MTEVSPNFKQSDKERLELYRMIFDNLHTGAIVTDVNGIVTHLNKPYADFLGLSVAECIGKHCTDLVESSRMHIVARTGQPEVNHMQMIRGRNIVVYRFPIKKNGQVVAAFGLIMFRDVDEMVRLAKRMHELESQLKTYKKKLATTRSTHYTVDSIIGNSRVITELKQDVLMAATNNYPVLVMGESGTGKELFAQSIHHASARSIHPFVQINCAAIPRELIEAELFGYERGAFTGARSTGKPGKFELANHGSIFLDEIGDLPIEMQPKLLRVLEEKVFERVGGNTVIQSDFRIIAATNQNLEQLIEQGRFRRDLYYRLNVISLNIPPLRGRSEDIAPLVRHLLRHSSEKHQLRETGISPAAMDSLMAHDWPGNVRELSNVLDRALATMKGETIEPGDLPFGDRSTQNVSSGSTGTPTIQRVQANAEKSAILAALEQTGNNKSKAAALLGIHRTLLYKKIKKHGIALGGNPTSAQS